MKVQLISVIAILAVLIGCPETPAETAVEVAQAREDAAQDVNEARRDANEAVPHEKPKVAYDVAQVARSAMR